LKQGKRGIKIKHMNKNKIKALKIVLDFVERWNKQDKEAEQCFCQSYFDDDNKLQDCTCGKCK